MYATTQCIYPVTDVFGAYIPEQHCDSDHCNLPRHDDGERQSRFEEILKSLRSALGIRRA